MRAWCNGRLIEPDSPAIAVLDHGFTVGDGVFEAVKVVDNVPFALTRHLDRLRQSAHGLGLPTPDVARIRRAIAEVLADDEIPLGRLRVTYTAGVSPLGSARHSTDVTLAVVAGPMPAYPVTTKAVVVPWPRNERSPLAGLKTTSFAENVIALAHAHERDATEALWVNTIGNLCEGSGTNVFCVYGDEVATPPLSAGCLPGVTRGLVIEWYGASERNITLDELADADEVFLTSTTRDVQGVHTLGDRVMPLATPVTDKVSAVWREREPQDSDP